MRFERLPLVWRIFAINATLLAVATILLALTPVTIHASIALVEVIDLVLALLIMLTANLLLLRHTIKPIDRLVERMRTIDLLRPGQRLVERGGVEVAELVRTFNQMLDRLETERRESGQRALRAQEGERLRIARGLHDEVGQVLTGVLLQLDSLARADEAHRRSDLEETKQAVRQALEEVRRIARELRPEMLEQLGLVSALTELSRKFASQSGVRVERRFAEGSAAALRRSGDRRLPGGAGEPDERRASRPGVARWRSRCSPASAVSFSASSTTAADCPRPPNAGTVTPAFTECASARCSSAARSRSRAASTEASRSGSKCRQEEP